MRLRTVVVMPVWVVKVMKKESATSSPSGLARADLRSKP